MAVEEVPQRYEQHLHAAPEILICIRRIIGAHLRLWGRDDLIDAVALCATEVLANVHKHTDSGECHLRLQNTPDGVRTMVSDTEPTLPTVREPDWCAESGRGMFILTSTAHRWGVLPTPTGKEVWFECRSAPLAPSPTSRLGPVHGDQAGQSTPTPSQKDA
ncbi:ATP-binding protein [Streptomyces sp. NBS 14/10]|uniref:ATP-binding protein n=1 Tax=Streptomyces sp. NBS 14/10 TaxID=1945643 RepID=UPI00211AC345|nr:ATP-binding protein [Streptomyces sp. NBS 14/10]KAK1179059.1 ATP-binding protein [Streptomyces sp. NBS 14/10]